jgi:hypothetical protein
MQQERGVPFQTMRWTVVLQHGEVVSEIGTGSLNFLRGLLTTPRHIRSALRLRTVAFTGPLPAGEKA